MAPIPKRKRSVSRGRSIIRGSSSTRAQSSRSRSSMSWSRGTRSASSRSSGGFDIGVTTKQSDTNIVYKKGRGKSRRKRSFQKRVRYAIQNELGDQTLTRNVVGSATNLPGKQNVVDYSIWGGGDIGVMNHDDLTQCYQGYNGGVGAPNAFILTQMANLDWIVTNLGEHPVVLKVLTCYAKTDTNQTPQQVWDAMDVNMSFLPNHTNLEGAIGKPDFNTANTLPFTSPEFCRVFTIKEVRKYQMAVGDIVSWRDTDKRRMKKLGSDYFQAKYKKGTKFIMIIWHGVNNSTAITAEGGKALAYPSCSISLMLSKTYKFNVLKDNYNSISFSNNTN